MHMQRCVRAMSVEKKKPGVGDCGWSSWTACPRLLRLRDSVTAREGGYGFVLLSYAGQQALPSSILVSASGEAWKQHTSLIPPLLNENYYSYNSHPRGHRARGISSITQHGIQDDAQKATPYTVHSGPSLSWLPSHDSQARSTFQRPLGNASELLGLRVPSGLTLSYDIGVRCCFLARQLRVQVVCTPYPYGMKL